MLGHALMHCSPLPVPLTNAFYYAWFGRASHMTG